MSKRKAIKESSRLSEEELLKGAKEAKDFQEALEKLGACPHSKLGAEENE